MTPADRNRLVEDHLRVAQSAAHRSGGTKDFDERLADAYLGLVQAARSFDPSRGVQFGTYAYTRVRGAIQDGLRQRDHLTQPMRAAGRDDPAPVSLDALCADIAESFQVPDPAAEDAFLAVEEADEHDWRLAWIDVHVGALSPQNQELVERLLRNERTVDIANDWRVTDGAISKRTREIERVLRELAVLEGAA